MDIKKNMYFSLFSKWHPRSAMTERFIWKIKDVSRLRQTEMADGLFRWCVQGFWTLIKELGVEWLNVFSVDNVLQKIADPVFVGAVLKHGCVCGSKVVAKADPYEKVGVLCLEDGRPSIVEYYEMTEEMIHLRDKQGKLLYNYGVY